MALALLFPDTGDTLFLDVVTNYAKTKASNVSSHPIDASSLIVDHVSKANPSFSLRAVISAADFNSSITISEGLLNPEEPESPRIETSPVNGAVLTSPSQLLDYLPSSIQSILGGQDTSSVGLDPFRGYSHEEARDLLNRVWEKSELITVLDYNYDIQTGRSVSVRSYPNCLITRFEDTEDVDTGDSMVVNLTMEQARFTYLKEVDVQISQQVPSAGVADEAAAEDDLGDQTSNGEAAEQESSTFADFVESQEGLGISDLTNFLNFGGN